MKSKINYTDKLKGKGSWGTINGVHVFISNEGYVSMGPPNLLSKTLEELKEGFDNKDTSTNEDSKSIAGINLEENSYDMVHYLLAKKDLNNVPAIIEAKGFNGLPHVLKSDEFDKYIKDGNIELSRGIAGSAAKIYAFNLMYSDFYVAGGEAYFGQGLYCFGGKSLNETWRYSASGASMRMALPKDAKVLEVKKGGLPRVILPENKKKEFDKYRSLHRDVTIGVGKDLENALKILGSKGYDVSGRPTDPYAEDFAQKNRNWKLKIAYAAEKYAKDSLSKEDFKLYKSTDKGTLDNVMAIAKGYDAIKLTSEYVNEHSNNGKQEIWIVFNRNKLRINEDVDFVVD